MIKRELVSKKMYNVKPNGSINTRQPSSVSMEIDHRVATRAADLFMDNKANKPVETGLIGFELVAVYEDGKPEEVVELKREVPVEEMKEEFLSDEMAEEAGVYDLDEQETE